MKATEAPGCSAEAAPLRERYSASDLAVLSADELARFVGDGPADPRENATLAWELLYRLEPELYDRLVQAERLHPAILEWLPSHVDRIVEVGAGSGRLTVELIHRCNELTAIEPAAPLRNLLRRKIIPSPLAGEGPGPPAHASRALVRCERLRRYLASSTPFPFPTDPPSW